MTAQALHWHEAGHALVAHLQGGLVVLVTTESEEAEREGHTEVHWREPQGPELSRKLALTALAGPLAELLFSGTTILEDHKLLAAFGLDCDEFEQRLDDLAQTPEQRQSLARELASELWQLYADAEIEERLARIADMLAAHETLDETLFLDAVV